MPNTVRLTSSHDVLEVAAGGVIEVEAGGTLNLQSGARLLVAGVPAAPTDLAITNPLTTQGDLIIADGDGAPAALGVGTDGDVLTADSGAALGISWQPAGGGFAPTITDPQDGDIIARVDGVWVNAPPAYFDGGDGSALPSLAPGTPVRLHAHWSPADPAVSEETTALTQPKGTTAMSLLTLQVVTAADAGTNNRVDIADSNVLSGYGGIINAFNPASDGGPVPNVPGRVVGSFGMSGYPAEFSTTNLPIDDPIVATYTAGDTPGTTAVVLALEVYVIVTGLQQ